MLTVVQDQEELFGREEADDAPLERDVGAWLHSECRRDELQQALAVARPCQFAYPCAVRVARLQLRRDLNRQARLADAAGTRQRHEPMLIE